MKNKLLVLCLVAGTKILSQSGPLFTNLPTGKYAVGFRIMTFIDSSRIIKPLYNYFGEKETGERYRKINVHVWYPAKQNADKKTLTYGDYCYYHILNSADEKIDDKLRLSTQNSFRHSFEGFFGKITDEDWSKLKQAKLLALQDAQPAGGQFPLLIGMLRPLSTTVTNEMLASNGYVVAMIPTRSGRLPLGYATDIADMQHAISFLSNAGMIEDDNIGTYGFSGSGFSQVLLAMNDPRIMALADIESALYGEGIWQYFSSSDYYNTSALRVPFLHIYGKGLAASDVKFEEFFRKKYSHRYHLLLNQDGLHHWDVATEGRASTTVLHQRGEKEPGIKASFELANIYLLHFFNATLKKSEASKRKMDSKASIEGYHDSLWSIHQYPAIQPPPDKAQFEEIIKRKGVNEGLRIAGEYKNVDSTADFIHQNALNQLAQKYHSEGKAKEALALMQLVTELHPGEAWLWLNMSKMQEVNKDIDGTIRSCEKVLDILKDFKGAEQSFNERIRRSAQATLQRLKKE